jgi:hypothetical protein
MPKIAVDDSVLLYWFYFFPNHQKVKKNLVHALIDRKILEGGKLDTVPVR